MVAQYIQSIGEVALRVRDMERMVSFYVDTLGFKLRRRFANEVAAIQVAQGVYGQVQTLTLFATHLPGNFKKFSWHGLNAETSPLHHFALTVKVSDYEAIQQELERLGLPYDRADHRWTGWRGIYIQDPELNIIELVCYDESLDEGKTGTYDFDKLHGSSTGQAFE
jgi:catechol 2,3-dioxygenase-like lactoylglutathione lyase family enzyme